MHINPIVFVIQETRRIEIEVLKRVEEEKQRIADELRNAEEEANQLEEEVQRIGNTHLVKPY